jgi:hypothetical protein
MCLSCTIEEVTGLDLSTDEGHDALEKLGRIPWPKADDRMLECAAYIAAMYAHPDGATGGPLHIVTDDFNVADDNLAFCRKSLDDGWPPHEDVYPDAEHVVTLAGWILELLDPMDEVGRSVTIALSHGDLAAVHGHIYMPSTEFPIREEIVDDDGNKVGTQWGFRHRTVES